MGKVKKVQQVGTVSVSRTVEVEVPNISPDELALNAARFITDEVPWTTKSGIVVPGTAVKPERSEVLHS